MKKKSKRYNQKQKKTTKLRCASCDKVITIPKPNTHIISIICPHCGHKKKLHPPFKTVKKKNTSLSKQTFQKNKDKPPAKKQSKTIKITKILSDNIIELILLSIGLLYLTVPTIHNIKISFTLILISTFLVFLMTGEHETTPYVQKKYSTKNPYHTRKLQSDSLRKKLQTIPQKIQSIPLSNRISIVLILWTLLIYVLTKDIEVYFILIFIGILITREITDMYTSNIYKKRLNAYIIIFLFTYIVLISQKIIEIIQA